MARPVVEQEQRPATLVGVLQLVELDQELGFNGHQRLCDDEQAERGADRAKLASPAADPRGFAHFDGLSGLIGHIISPDAGRVGRALK